MGALLSVWAVTPVTFLDCCFHVIATGTVSNPLIEKANGSKEKLALVINVTSSQCFEFISRTVGATVPKLFIPAIVFLVGTFTSYFIGSSWATWALIMPIGLQLALSSGANIPLIVGAVLAGGSVGDNVSPLGETPVLTASITEVSIIDHVQTTLPYALVVIGLSTILFIVTQALLG